MNIIINDRGNHRAFAICKWGIAPSGNSTWENVGYFSSRTLARAAQKVLPDIIATVEVWLRPDHPETIYTSWEQYKADNKMV